MTRGRLGGSASRKRSRPEGVIYFWRLTMVCLVVYALLLRALLPSQPSLSPPVMGVLSWLLPSLAVVDAVLGVYIHRRSLRIPSRLGAFLDGSREEQDAHIVATFFVLLAYFEAIALLGLTLGLLGGPPPMAFGLLALSLVLFAIWIPTPARFAAIRETLEREARAAHDLGRL